MKIQSSHMLWLPFVFACTQEGTEVQKFNLAPSVSFQKKVLFWRENRLFWSVDQWQRWSWFWTTWSSDLQGELVGLVLLMMLATWFFQRCAHSTLKTMILNPARIPLPFPSQTLKMKQVLTLFWRYAWRFLQLIHPQPNESVVPICLSILSCKSSGIRRCVGYDADVLVIMKIWLIVPAKDGSSHSHPR